VIEVEAASLDDADEISRRLVSLHGEKFSEILLYVQAAPGPEDSPIRRIQWTRSGGFATLDFVGSLHR
jgi:hypothetical protein